jgi:hypothetical protein
LHEGPNQFINPLLSAVGSTMATRSSRKPKRRPAQLWSVERVAHVAYMLGRGYSSNFVAEGLLNETHPRTVRTLVYRWLQMIPGTAGMPWRDSVVIQLRPAELALLEQRATAAGCSPEVWLSRIIDCAARDDLFAAVVG